MVATVIGDLHGDINFYHEIKSKSDDHLILTGDLLDSFVYTRAEQYKLMELVLNDIEDGRTDCVFGNHELSYLMPRMRCSGYASSFDTKLMHLKSRMWKLMKPYIFDNKVLITHAGLNSQQYRQLTGNNPDPNMVESFLWESWQKVDSGSIYNIGHSRGGSSTNAGIFWSDYFVDFNPIDGLIQIFGHTPVKEIQQKETNWCIDCLQYSKDVVRLDGNTVTIVK